VQEISNNEDKDINYKLNYL